MFENLVAQRVKTLAPYEPGKPQEELERELGIAGAVKLASNENPLGPSPRAVEAMAEALPRLHRYPDGRGYYLKEALARKHGIRPDQIVLGNGSNEIIELSVRTFLEPGMGVVCSYPTFLMYSKIVQGAGGLMKQAPLKDFRHDLKALLKLVDDRTRLLFLDNPNNPSGSLVPVEDLESFASDLPPETILVLDEAYIDFVRTGAAAPDGFFLDSDHPVIRMRTFSKAYGLAGLRVGYGLAQSELVGYMDRIRQPFNVNTPAQIGALAALDDRDFYERTISLVAEGLAWIEGKVDELGLKTYPSETNFVMIELDRPASEVSEKMLHEGVIVRSLAGYGLERVLRINIGLPEENERFIAALAKVLGK